MRDYYASPNGTGDGSPGSPSSVSAFWRVAQPGDALYLLPGRYAGPASMIAPPAGLAGVDGAPIVVKALTDGTVEIDGEGKYCPVNFRHNAWLHVRGLNVHDSDRTVVSLMYASHCEIRRVCAWGGGKLDSGIFGVHYSEDNLLEDCAGWGRSRKVFSNSQGGIRITRRRCLGIWQTCLNVGEKSVFNEGYNSHHNTDENCVALWDAQMPDTYVLTTNAGGPYTGAAGGTYMGGTVQAPYALFFGGHNGRHVRLLGCIACVVPGKKFDQPDQSDANRPRGGMWFRNMADMELRDCYSIMPPDQDVRPFFLDGTDVPEPGSLIATNLTSVGSRASIVRTPWQVTRLHEHFTPAEADLSSKLRAMRRYKDGVLTDELLFPWPMGPRIHAAMILSGDAPIRVTEQLGLPIPVEADPTPVEPEPAPIEPEPAPAEPEPVSIEPSVKPAGWLRGVGRRLKRCYRRRWK